jgi:hypothetical protein
MPMQADTQATIHNQNAGAAWVPAFAGMTFGNIG